MIVLIDCWGGFKIQTFSTFTISTILGAKLDLPLLFAYVQKQEHGHLKI